MIHYSAAAKRKARREARRTRARAGDNAARADLSRQARRDALRYMTALELYGRPVAAGRGDGVVLESRELYRKRNGSLAGWALYRWFYRGI